MAFRYDSPLDLFTNSDSGKKIYTYFCDGTIVELPTRWLRAISHQPRYSGETVRQYGANIKDFLNWFLDAPKYPKLTLDTVLKVATRKDVEDWIKDRKAASIKASTLRNREVTVKLLFDWLTTVDGGKVRRLEDTPYKTGKLISPPPTNRKPRFITVEDMIRLFKGYYNESERCLAHTLYARESILSGFGYQVKFRDRIERLRRALSHSH